MLRELLLPVNRVQILTMPLALGAVVNEMRSLTYREGVCLNQKPVDGRDGSEPRSLL